MLVLGRDIGEKILIGNDIVVTVLRKGGKSGIRIGIDAPDDVRIIRAELAEPPEGTQNADNPKMEDT